MSRELLRFQAAYNAWANKRLCDVIAKLPEESFRANAGVVFRSIQGTLNHILLTDKLWMGRFEGKMDTEEYEKISSYWRSPGAGYSTSESTECIYEKYIPDRDKLIEEFLKQSERTVAFFDSLPEDFDSKLLDSRSTRGREYTIVKSKAYFHFLNHATHHRGQITAAITNLGGPVVEIDASAYAWLDGSAKAREN